MKYIRARAEVVMFDNSDVITASNPGGNGCKDATGSACINPGYKNIQGDSLGVQTDLGNWID